MAKLDVVIGLAKANDGTILGILERLEVIENGGN